MMVLQNIELIPENTLEDLTVTDNGTFQASEGFRAIRSVTVDVEKRDIDLEDALLTGSGNLGAYSNERIAALKDYGLYNLDFTTLDLPNVARTGTYALYGINASSVNMPELITAGGSAFRSSTIGSVTLPKLQTISGYCFYQCRGLTELYLPALITIGASALRYCYDLERLELDSVTSIGGMGLQNSSKLATLVIRTPTMCPLSATTVISGTAIANGTGYVYVPDELVEEYKNATNWSTIADAIKPLSELV